jgi:hypothetical protein
VVQNRQQNPDLNPNPQQHKLLKKQEEAVEVEGEAVTEVAQEEDLGEVLAVDLVVALGEDLVVLIPNKQLPNQHQQQTQQQSQHPHPKRAGEITGLDQMEQDITKIVCSIKMLKVLQDPQIKDYLA